jgi:hypothetical protein
LLAVNGERSGETALVGREVPEKCSTFVDPDARAVAAKDVNFVSRRVGNYEHGPDLGMLIDQLWGSVGGGPPGASTQNLYGIASLTSRRLPGKPNEMCSDSPSHVTSVITTITAAMASVRRRGTGRSSQLCP